MKKLLIIATFVAALGAFGVGYAGKAYAWGGEPGEGSVVDLIADVLSCALAAQDCV